jgi:hypothetical protein
VPEGEELEKLKFEPDSDEESEAGEAGGESWGGGGDSAPPVAIGGDAWGSSGDAAPTDASAGVSGGNAWASGGGDDGGAGW